VPCLTVRPNTERPATISHGTNRLVPATQGRWRKDDIVNAVRGTAFGVQKDAPCPELWDGWAAERIAERLG
jgi:UDP-N-acetylglucosamine 2-epimerase (non-hydrolysing)